MIPYHKLNILLRSWSLLSRPKILEVSKNVKYIAVTSRASKLQIFKVWPGWDLNPGLPGKSHNIGTLTHGGGPCSNPGQGELWRFVPLKPLKLQQCTLHFWKPLIFFYLDKRVQGHSYVFNTQKAFVNIPGFTIVSLLAGYISIWLSVSMSCPENAQDWPLWNGPFSQCYFTT